jgi:hypothetical protein
MRTSILRMGCVAVALAALVSYPGASFGLDCSYGGAINPPLQDVNPPDGFCDAHGQITAKGGMDVTLNNPLEVTPPGMRLKVTDEFGTGFLIPGTFRIFQSMVTTIAPISEAILLDVAGQLLNQGGVFYLVAHFDQVRLTAKSSIMLQGNPALLNPSTFLVGDYIKLTSTLANILIDNTFLVAYGDDASIELLAPRSSIQMTNSVLVVLQNAGADIGTCKFQVKKSVAMQGTSGSPDNFGRIRRTPRRSSAGRQ